MSEWGGSSARPELHRVLGAATSCVKERVSSLLWSLLLFPGYGGVTFSELLARPLYFLSRLLWGGGGA